MENNTQVGGSHYKDAKYQHWDFAIDNRLGYIEGQITKYVTRWRKKNGIEDLEKAIHFLDKLQEALVSGQCTVCLKCHKKITGLNEFVAAHNLNPIEARVIAGIVNHDGVANRLHSIREDLRKLMGNYIDDSLD